MTYHFLLGIDFFSPRRLGGASKVFYDLAQGLSRRGHRVTLFFRTDPGLDFNLKFSNLPVFSHIFSYQTPARWGPFLRTYGLGRVRTQLLQYCQRHPVDAVHLHHPLGLPPLFPLPSSIPILYTLHSPWSEEFLTRERVLRMEEEGGVKAKMGLGRLWGKELRLRLERRAVRRSAAVTTLSQYMKTWVQRLHHLPSHRIHVLGAGVDLQTFCPPQDKGQVRCSLGIPLHKKVIFTLRALIWRTGVDLLLEALSILKKKMNASSQTFPFLLLIGGQGYARSALENQTHLLGLEAAVRFLGFIPTPELPRYYQSADVCVMPTRYLEGFGISILESLACGTPVLATPEGGMSEVLTPLNPDFLFKSIDAQSIAQGLGQFFSRYPSPEKLSAESRQYVEQRYSLDSFIGRYESLFQQEIEKSRDHSRSKTRLGRNGPSAWGG